MDIIEGVGNEVLLSTVIVFVIAGVSILIFYRYLVNSAEVRSQSEHIAQETTMARNRVRNSDDRNCPICIDEAKFGIETNCGHIFCSSCFFRCWQEGNSIYCLNCPVCRQQVAVLFPAFSEEEITSAENIEERSRVITDINEYNRKFSGEPRPWISYVRDLPTMLRHLWSEFFSLGGLVYMFRFRIVICLLAGLMYLISPLDIIPEAMFGFLGLLDDIFIIFLIMIYISIIYRRVLASRADDM